MEIRIIYLSLFLLMFWGLFYGGKGIKEKNTWLMAIGILAFTLNEGLRFGRWIDYNNYYFFYNEVLLPNQERFSEPIFIYICRFIDSIGGNFQTLIIFMSFMHIFAAVFFLRLYKDVAFFSLPFFVLFTYSSAENLLRWYLGFSFLLVGLFYFLSEDRKKKRYFILFFFALISVNIHFGLILVVPLFTLIYYVKRTIPPLFSIPLYIVLAYFFQLDYMLEFKDIVNSLSFLGDRSEVYIANSDKWLTSYALGLEKESGFRGFATTAVYILCVYGGYKLLPFFGKKYLYAYNIFIMGFLINPIAVRVEILERIDFLLLMFISVILAYLVKYTIFINLLPKYKYLNVIVFLIVFNYARGEITKPFKRDTETLLYVWDKKGRQYLDNYKVYFIDMYNSNKKK